MSTRPTAIVFRGVEIGGEQHVVHVAVADEIERLREHAERMTLAWQEVELANTTLRAENERLTHLNDLAIERFENATASPKEAFMAGVDCAAHQIIDLKTENERLRAALTRFGKHLNTCSYFKDGPHQASPETVCDCGLVAACQI